MEFALTGLAGRSRPLPLEISMAGHEPMRLSFRRSIRMKERFLDHLKHAAGDASVEPWTEDQIPYFFQRFRPDGNGIERALAPLRNAADFVKRLLPVYEMTRHVRWADDMYFVIRQPR